MAFSFRVTEAHWSQRRDTLCTTVGLTLGLAGHCNWISNGTSPAPWWLLFADVGGDRAQLRVAGMLFVHDPGEVRLRCRRVTAVQVKVQLAGVFGDLCVA